MNTLQSSLILVIFISLPIVKCFGQSDFVLKPMTGGFIQYNSDIIKTKNNLNGWSKENWESELKAFQIFHEKMIFAR